MSRWVHPGIRAVFFDAVGTLLFPIPGALLVYSQAALRLGLDLPHTVLCERFIAAYRAEEEADRAAGWATSEAREVARWRRIVTEALAGVRDPEACFAELFDHFALPSAWTVNPDAAAVLPALRDRGLILGLASNYDARLESVLTGHPVLAPIRERVVISAAVGFRKPAVEFFREVALVAGCEPNEILLVGDDLGNDYRGAVAVGMEAVLLIPPPNAADPPPPVERWITSLAELLDPA